jgi:hypothetical protein
MPPHINEVDLAIEIDGDCRWLAGAAEKQGT